MPTNPSDFHSVKTSATGRYLEQKKHSKDRSNSLARDSLWFWQCHHAFRLTGDMVILALSVVGVPTLTNATCWSKQHLPGLRLLQTTLQRTNLPRIYILGLFSGTSCKILLTTLLFIYFISLHREKNRRESCWCRAATDVEQDWRVAGLFFFLSLHFSSFLHLFFSLTLPIFQLMHQL